MSRVLVMSYRQRCELRFPLPIYGDDYEPADAVSAAIHDAVRRHLAGLPNVEPTSVRFRVEDRP